MLCPRNKKYSGKSAIFNESACIQCYHIFIYALFHTILSITNLKCLSVTFMLKANHFSSGIALSLDFRSAEVQLTLLGHLLLGLFTSRQPPHWP